MTATLLIQLAAGIAAGSALAWLYLRALRSSVAGLPRRERPGLAWLAGFALRVALAAAAFAAVARFLQAPGLAAALAGFVLVRNRALGRLRREAAAAAQARTPP